MNEPNPAVNQPHLDSALTQLNNHRHALEAELEAIVAGITALESKLTHPSRELNTTNPNLFPQQHTQPVTIPVPDPEQTETPPTQTPPLSTTDTWATDDTGTPLRIVTPLESTIPDGSMNAGQCPKTTDGNHVANKAGMCIHCGSQVTTPI
jgi:hypothetical protein